MVGGRRRRVGRLPGEVKPTAVCCRCGRQGGETASGATDATRASLQAL